LADRSVIGRRCADDNSVQLRTGQHGVQCRVGGDAGLLGTGTPRLVRIADGGDLEFRNVPQGIEVDATRAPQSDDTKAGRGTVFDSRHLLFSPSPRPLPQPPYSP